MRLIRFAVIAQVAWRHGIFEFVPGKSWSARLLRHYSRHPVGTRAQRLRVSLEELGPIFVKFGQMLSTRRDLLPGDIADELAKLQDRVPPFPGKQAVAIIEQAFGQPINTLYSSFNEEPVASASVAQVHFATLPDGQEVAVKILRPGLEPVIEHDIQLMEAAAWLVEKLFSDGPRLRPREVVSEFARYLRDELDLVREAANCSQLRRNFAGSPLLAVPEVYWDWCATEVMTMQRMHGIPVGRIGMLRDAGIDLKKLSRAGVEIFFTQVFRDGYFHADMHPGNILVAPNGQYIALDFGIMGSLTDNDKHYLAVNFLAFFHRDYRRVAEAHIECGWAPADTRLDEFEFAIRAVCEPIFDKPLSQISFGKVLLRLFQTSRRFGIEIQPQLVMLQKTLLNIEGLGRELDPELDLWDTAKPYLEKWMKDQLGVRALFQQLKKKWPRLVHTLSNVSMDFSAVDKKIEQLGDFFVASYQMQHRQLWVLKAVLMVLLISAAWVVWHVYVLN